MKYPYQNVHDLCLGHSLMPIRLRSSLELGRHYLVPLMQWKLPQNLGLEESLSLLQNELSRLANMPNHTLYSLIVEITLNNKFLENPSHLSKLILPLSQELSNWRKQRRVKISLAIHMPVEIDLFGSDSTSWPSLFPYVNELANSGVDLLRISINSDLPDYQESLKAGKLLEPLSIFHKYYEKMRLLFFSLACEYEHPCCPVCVSAPEFMIPELSSTISKIYTPFAIAIASKLISLPSMADRSHALFCSRGEGILAKAMTGATLITPSFAEPHSLSSLAVAYTDVMALSTTLPCNMQIYANLHSLVTMSQYFNTLHQKEGYSANRETRRVLLKSLPEKTPTQLILDHPRLCNIAKMICSSGDDFVSMYKVFRMIAQILATAHKEGELILDKAELSLLKSYSQELKEHL